MFSALRTLKCSNQIATSGDEVSHIHVNKYLMALLRMGLHFSYVHGFCWMSDAEEVFDLKFDDHPATYHVRLNTSENQSTAMRKNTSHLGHQRIPSMVTKPCTEQRVQECENKTTATEHQRQHTMYPGCSLRTEPLVSMVGWILYTAFFFIKRGPMLIFSRKEMLLTNIQCTWN